MIKLTETQLKMLESFLEYADSDYCYIYTNIEEWTGLDRKTLQKEMKLLLKLKYIDYVKGLMDDEGMVAGSGFMLNYQNRQKVRDLVDTRMKGFVKVSDMEGQLMTLQETKKTLEVAQKCFELGGEFSYRFFNAKFDIRKSGLYVKVDSKKKNAKR